MVKKFLFVTLLSSGLAAAQTASAKRPPLKFKVASQSCPLEYKPMGNAKATWKSYARQLKLGTTIQGFTKGKEDLFTFRSANPKNLYFRGSLACLRGGKTAAKVPLPTSPMETAVDDSTLTVGLSYWGGELTMASTDASFPSEELVTKNFAANVGYSKQLHRVGASSLGIQAIVSVGYSLLSNKDKKPATKFKGSGVVGAVQLRPYYYYQIGGMGVGPLVAISAWYGVYGSTEDGNIRKPLVLVALTGLSLKISPAGHTVDVGVANFKPAQLHAAVNFAF